MKSTNLYKGSLITIILKLLNEHDKMYGYEITKKVKDITKNELQLTEGALYPALHKLEAKAYWMLRFLELETEFVNTTN